MDTFKTPSFVSQDLLLIQSLLGTASKVSPPPAQAAPLDSDEDIASSSSEYASEDEIEDVLIVKEEDEEMKMENGSKTDALVKLEQAPSPYVSSFLFGLFSHICQYRTQRLGI